MTFQTYTLSHIGILGRGPTTHPTGQLFKCKQAHFQTTPHEIAVPSVLTLPLAAAPVHVSSKPSILRSFPNQTDSRVFSAASIKRRTAMTHEPAARRRGGEGGGGRFHVISIICSSSARVRRHAPLTRGFQDGLA